MYLLGSPEEYGADEGNPYHGGLPVFLALVLRNLKHDLVGLEREEDLEQHPCDDNHYEHVRNHTYSPLHEVHFISCLGKELDGGSVRRGSDRGSYTTEVRCYRYGQGETYAALVVLREHGKHRSKESEHHGCGSGVAHEHGEYRDDQKEAEEHHLGVGAERLEEEPRHGHVKTVLLRHDREDETSEEEHDHRIGE